MTTPITTQDIGMAEMPDPKPDAPRFITWHGGECPVPGGTEVKVRFRNGDLARDCAEEWEWEHIFGEEDIVAYRLVSPAPASAPDSRDEEIRRQEPPRSVHEYAQEYEFRDPDYVPSDGERSMIEDAINGYLGEIATPAPERDGEAQSERLDRAAAKAGDA